VSRDRVVSIATTVIAVCIAAAAFVVADAWWQTVLLLIVALAVGLGAASGFGRAAKAADAAAAARVLHSEETASDVRRLKSLPDSMRERAFLWAGGVAADARTWNVQVRGSSPRSPCPCCRYLTLLEPDDYEICPVCFWEDDGHGDADADKVYGGPNGSLSLAQARRNYLAFGACDRTNLELVRPPRPDEFPKQPREGSNDQATA
jgi:hypothetical protein